MVVVIASRYNASLNYISINVRQMRYNINSRKRIRGIFLGQGSNCSAQIILLVVPGAACFFMKLQIDD